MALNAGLRKDIAGERKAIRDYSQRIQQSKGSGVTPILKHIRGEEQEHRGELQKALSGLKSARKNNE
jgi:rubrerythrin